MRLVCGKSGGRTGRYRVLSGFREWSQGDKLAESLVAALLTPENLRYSMFDAEIKSQLKMRSVDTDGPRIALYKAYDIPDVARPISR